MIPKEIERIHIKKAMAFIDEYGVPKLRRSKHWDIIDTDGEAYPPKYVISKANEFTTNKNFWTHEKFVTTEARTYLKRVGFNVVKRSDVLDNYVNKKHPTLDEKIKVALKNLSTEPKPMQKIIIERTLRNDTPIIRNLKKKYNYKCQMPGCNASIQKANGEYYIEVAHIASVSSGGKSILGNLLVLCPNHHKEFDFGSLIIQEQSLKILKGKLNSKKFMIRF